MNAFDAYELCPACGNDPVESGLKWRPKFVKCVEPGVVVACRQCLNPLEKGVHTCGNITSHLEVFCGQCRYSMKRACINEL